MGSLTETVTDLLTIGLWYERHAWAVDGLVYLILFVSLTKVSLGQRFEGRAGTALVVVVGTALAIGAATAAHRVGFTLGELGPFAWVCVAGVVGLAVYERIQSLGISMIPGIAITVLVLAGLYVAVRQFLPRSPIVDTVSVVAQLSILVAIGALVLWFSFKRTSTTEHSEPILEQRQRPRTEQANRHGKLSIEITSAEQLEASMPDLIERLRQHVTKRGIDGRTHRLLGEIRYQRRLIQRCYRRSLRQLARQRGVHGRQSPNLSRGLEATLHRAAENMQTFERQWEIAQSGHRAVNPDVVLQAVEAMVRTEEEGQRIAAELHELHRQTEGRNRSEAIRR